MYCRHTDSNTKGHDTEVNSVTAENIVQVTVSAPDEESASKAKMELQQVISAAFKEISIRHDFTEKTAQHLRVISELSDIDSAVVTIGIDQLYLHILYTNFTCFIYIANLLLGLM